MTQPGSQANKGMGHGNTRWGLVASCGVETWWPHVFLWDSGDFEIGTTYMEWVECLMAWQHGSSDMVQGLLE